MMVSTSWERYNIYLLQTHLMETSRAKEKETEDGKLVLLLVEEQKLQQLK